MSQFISQNDRFVVVVVVLFYVHGKHLRSCRDGQYNLTTLFPGQAQTS